MNSKRICLVLLGIWVMVSLAACNQGGTANTPPATSTPKVAAAQEQPAAKPPTTAPVTSPAAAVPTKQATAAPKPVSLTASASPSTAKQKGDALEQEMDRLLQDMASSDTLDDVVR